MNERLSLSCNLSLSNKDLGCQLKLITTKLGKLTWTIKCGKVFPITYWNLQNWLFPKNIKIFEISFDEVPSISTSFKTSTAKPSIQFFKPVASNDFEYNIAVELLLAHWSDACWPVGVIELLSPFSFSIAKYQIFDVFISKSHSLWKCHIYLFQNKPFTGVSAKFYRCSVHLTGWHPTLRFLF